MRSVRFCNLLTLQVPTGDQIHLASNGGVKLLPNLQLSSVLKIKAHEQVVHVRTRSRSRKSTGSESSLVIVIDLLT